MEKIKNEMKKIKNILAMLLCLALVSPQYAAAGNGRLLVAAGASFVLALYQGAAFNKAQLALQHHKQLHARGLGNAVNTRNIYLASDSMKYRAMMTSIGGILGAISLFFYVGSAVAADLNPEVELVFDPKGASAESIQQIANTVPLVENFQNIAEICNYPEIEEHYFYSRGGRDNKNRINKVVNEYIENGCAIAAYKVDSLAKLYYMIDNKLIPEASTDEVERIAAHLNNNEDATYLIPIIN